MPEFEKWQKYNPTIGYLVALDISGFSNNPDPDELFSHRMNFFNSVEQTPLFALAEEQNAVKVHFLGDELQLAFHAEVGAGKVRSFIDDVFAGLQRINKRLQPEHQTRIKGVVLTGVVIWKSWRNCEYLDGPLPVKAQVWMRLLSPNEVAIDDSFKHALQVEGIATNSFSTREFAGEKGYVLRG